MGYNVKHGGYSNTVHLKITKKQSLKVIIVIRKKMSTYVW